jgi:hypothetical protein
MATAFNARSSSSVVYYTITVITTGAQSAAAQQQTPAEMWWHTVTHGRGSEGELANGVGSQYSHTTSEHGVSSITTADAHT